MAGWYERKTKEYRRYKDDCIGKGIPNQSLMETTPLSTFNSNTNEFELVWTSPAPRIGIIARSPATTTLVSLYNFMSQVRSNIESQLSQRDKSISNFGCHFCLYVHGQSGTAVTCRQGQVLNENGQLSTNENMVGYIQIDESQYILWLPSNLKQPWFNAFRQAEHFVDT